jgi:integrase
MREAELLGIRSKDLDFKNGIINVKDGYHKVKGKVDKGLKNGESLRPVKIPSFLANELQEFVESLGPMDPNARVFVISAAIYYAIIEYYDFSQVKLIIKAAEILRSFYYVQMIFIKCFFL